MIFCISYKISSKSIIARMRYNVKKNISYNLTFYERKNMFIEKLEETLKQKHLTMNKLAKAIDFSQSATSQWKKGRMPQIDVLKKICLYLNVSADYLLDLDETPPPILTDQEQQLLEHFRQCSPGEKESILLLANAGANKAEQEKESLNSKIVG